MKLDSHVLAFPEIGHTIYNVAHIEQGYIKRAQATPELVPVRRYRLWAGMDSRQSISDGSLFL